MTKLLLKLQLLTVLVVVLAVASSFGEDVKTHIREALDKGDTTMAIKFLREDMELDKGYHYNYYTLGRIYFAREMYDKAKEQFEIALEKKSKHYESMYYLGLTYIKLEQYDKALEIMKTGQKKARKINDMFDNGYGLVMMMQGNYDEAVKAFMKALVDHDDNSEYHINLGDAYFNQGVPSLAAMEYEKVLTIDTGSTEVYFHWAEACFQMKDYSCTFEKLQAVLSKDSTHAPAWKRAGAIYFKAASSTRDRQERISRYRDAIGSYKKYLTLANVQPDSSTVRVFFELGMSYVNLNGFEDAVDYFDKVLAIPMEPRDIYFYYGKSLWGIQDFDKAATMLKKHIEWVAEQGEDYKTTVDDYELYQLLGDCFYYRKPNDFYTAVSYYKKSLEIYPEQKRLLYNTAVALHSLKKFGEALTYYDRRIELGIDSSSFNIYKNAGFCALNIANAETDEGEELDEMLNEGEDVASPDAGIDPNINYSDLSINYLKKYLEFKNDDVSVIMMIANTYYQMSDFVNGVKYYEQVLTIEPGNCAAQKSLGYAYFGGLETKNYTKALRYLLDAQKCLAKSGGECSDVNILLWIGQCYHLRAVDTKNDAAQAKSDFKNAYDWYGRCLKCDPGQPDCKDGQNKVRFEF
ncbi:MAG: tetratricopeptide repeat protein [candidate division Zixibacteria bacterium]|nr:tetratricopeptide repeat protein [candidate division Zixibacteria bacterium]